MQNPIFPQQANFPAVSEVCFLLFSSKLVRATKMSKFIRETRARIADAYGNKFIKDRVVLLCVSSTNSELIKDLHETTKDECKARL